MIKYQLLLGCYYNGKEDFYGPTAKIISSTIKVVFKDGTITSKTCSGGTGKSGKGSNGLFSSSSFWGLVNSFYISSVTWTPS